MRLIASFAALVAVATPLSARAQSHGIGFPIGDKSRVHTNLDVGVGYDSNSLRLSEENGNREDWKALIRPGLMVNVPGSSLQFDLRAQLTISQFFGVATNNPETEFGALIGAKLRAGQKDSVVGFELDETLVRTPAQIDDLGSFAASERRFKEWANRARAVIELRPGGGALEFDVGYQNELSFFQGESLPDSQSHGAVFEAKLRFLPKTAVLFHSDIMFFDATGRESEDGRGTLKSSPLNLTIGLVGQVTSRLTTDLEVGYGDTFTVEEGSSFFSNIAESRTGTIIGRAELTYDILESSRITVGFRRQVKPVILLNSYASNTPYLRFILGVGARLAFGLYGSYEWRDFGTFDSAAQLLIGDARVDYWFFEFLTASINYRVIRQDATVVASIPANLAEQLEDYTRHETMLMIGLRY
jgi:hypothetical protein